MSKACKSGKTRFRSYKAAIEHLALKGSKLDGPLGPRGGVYRCPSCGRYHITRNSRRRR